jgi:hypothetical protein
LAESPELVGDVCPEYEDCLGLVTAIDIRSALIRLDLVPSITDDEIDKSIEIVKEIYRFTCSVSYKEIDSSLLQASTATDEKVKSRHEQYALEYADSIANLINNFGFNICEFTSDTTNTFLVKFAGLMSFYMRYQDEPGSPDVVKLISKLN